MVTAYCVKDKNGDIVIVGSLEKCETFVNTKPNPDEFIIQPL